jgi:hypothetical protein
MKRCFVISPIGSQGSPEREHADDVFDYVISPAMEKCDIAAFRSDHLKQPGMISEQMYRAILNEDFCIALLTGFNPNVFYELAIAQAANRPVIILLENGNELPFDIKDLRCVYYDLKPRSLFTGIYADQVAAHVKELEGLGWRVSGPLSEFLPDRDSGVEIMATTREFGPHSQWMELIEPTEHRLALMGINLNNWKKSKGFRQTLVRKAKAGCQVQILLMDPANPALRSLINDKAQDDAFPDIIFGVNQMLGYFGELAEEHENIKLRTILNGCCHFNLTLCDGAAVIIQYLYSESGAYAPLIRCSAQSPLYQTFAQEFTSLWTTNDPAIASPD